jgi:hypothetical protein
VDDPVTPNGNDSPRTGGAPSSDRAEIQPSAGPTPADQWARAAETGRLEEHEYADDLLDAEPVDSDARSRDLATQRRRRRILLALIVLSGLGLVAAGFEPVRVIIAMVAMFVLFRMGLGAIGAFARPVPDPPPPGELRRVRLTYRCTSCGTELRMTLANDQVPEPPRHCADDMELTTAVEDL